MRRLFYVTICLFRRWRKHLTILNKIIFLILLISCTPWRKIIIKSLLSTIIYVERQGDKRANLCQDTNWKKHKIELMPKKALQETHKWANAHLLELTLRCVFKNEKWIRFYLFFVPLTPLLNKTPGRVPNNGERILMLVPKKPHGGSNG